MNTKLPDPKSKIMELERSLEWRKQLRREHRKLVVTNGCFDILHRGHAEYLYEARQFGDALLLALNSDASIKLLKGPSRPVVKENDRAYLLASLSCVDAVVIFDTLDCTELFLSLKPDIYVKGGDYNINTINQEERAILSRLKAEVKFVKLVPDFSTTHMIEKLEKA